MKFETLNVRGFEPSIKLLSNGNFLGPEPQPSSIASNVGK
jgi:hypothetical protein